MRTLYLTRDHTESLPLALWTARPRWNGEKRYWEGDEHAKQLTLLRGIEAARLFGVEELGPGEIAELYVEVAQ